VADWAREPIWAPILELRTDVIALPGGIMPAAIRYASLQKALATEVDFHVKDLELYAGDAPPPGYAIDLEVDALARFADSLGLERFHLLGYSGGGFISLAFAGTHSRRLLSLAVFEAARIPGRLTPAEADFYAGIRAALAGKQGSDFMGIFVSRNLREGVESPPPSEPSPPWMLTRPAGLAAMLKAFDEYRFDRSRFRDCNFPVLYSYGGLTHPKEELQAAVLSGLLADVRIRRFDGIHHFVPPEDIYNADHIQALRELWAHARSSRVHLAPH
jgi:pimeloyl-ACP methyl ester carboxylesterase